MSLYTIGHSNHAIGRFLGLLRQHEIALVADVRSVPHSRRHPQFNKDALTASLADTGVGYEFLGRELGARAEDPLLYESGRVSYMKLAATGFFQFGLDRLRELAATKHTAMMCAEKEPLDCHRTLLVAQAIETPDSWRARGRSRPIPGLRGTCTSLCNVPAGLKGVAAGDGGPPVESSHVEVLHIHADGTLESHRDCLLRLVASSKLPAEDLFRSEEERIAEACARREEKIAYRR